MKLLIIISLSLTVPPGVFSFVHHGPWLQLKSASKKIMPIESSDFERSLDYCKQLGGNLITFHDTEEATRVVDELSKMSGRPSNYWIGLKQYQDDCFLRWTNGDRFQRDQFIVSPVDRFTGNCGLCGLIRISRGLQGYNYSIAYESCYSYHPALCEAASNTYETLAIAAVTLSGLCLVIIFVYVGFKWLRNRMTVYATNEPMPDRLAVNTIGQSSDAPHRPISQSRSLQ